MAGGDGGTTASSSGTYIVGYALGYDNSTTTTASPFRPGHTWYVPDSYGTDSVCDSYGTDSACTEPQYMLANRDEILSRIACPSPGQIIYTATFVPEGSAYTTQAVPPARFDRRAFDAARQQMEAMRLAHREAERITGMQEVRVGQPLTATEIRQREADMIDRAEAYQRLGMPSDLAERRAQRQAEWAEHAALHDEDPLLRPPPAGYYHRMEFINNPEERFGGVDVGEDWKAIQKKKEEAENRAQELLGMVIGSEMLRVYKRTGRLFVKGKRHSYIVQKEGYILQIDKDKVTDLCVHLEKRDSMPLTDNVLAMKLSIETDEDRVLKMANKWGEHRIGRNMYALPECAGMEESA